jgi:hypothetical protein
MTLPNAYELNREVLPPIRRQVLAIADRDTQDILFSLLGLIHDLVEEVDGLKQRELLG